MSAPRLRFSEFNSQWQKKTLQDLADVKGGKRIQKGYSLQEEDNGLPYITVSDMHQGGVDLKCIRYVPKSIAESIKNYKISKDDIFISVAGTLGVVGIVPLKLDNANLTENANKLTNLKCNQIYLLQYLMSDRLANLIGNVQTIGAQPKLAIYALNSFEVHLPAHAEQTKIANFLTAVDEKLSQLTRKLDLLTQYKKGVMQQIFSQEMRFKDDDGREFPEWEERELSEVFKVSRGNVLSMTLVSTEQSAINQYPVYSSQTKNNGLSGYYKDYLYENCITWTTDGANAGDVNYRLGRFYCTNVCGVLMSSEGYANTCVAELINAVSKKYVSYVGNPKLMNNVMAKIKIAFPSVQEQTKIANFLTAIDDKITTTKTQLEAVKQYKQGLLQQMFV